MQLAIVYTFVIAASTLVGVQGQFPRTCINTRDLTDLRCCPVPNGYEKPCGSDKGRGVCKHMEHRGKWNDIYDHFDKDHTIDDRHDWPRLFFNRTCHCNSSFSGPDCSKCEFGYHGDNCEKRGTLLKRRNFMKLSQEDKDQYMWYVNLSRHAISDYVAAATFYSDIQNAIAQGEDPLSKFVNVSVYDLYVWQHYYAARNTYLNDSTIKRDIDFAHEGQGFPTWHRYYLLSWERALQEITGDYNFAVPYWDWTENELNELCTKELLGENTASKIVKGKYFDGWYSICTQAKIDKLEEEGTRICNSTKDREKNLEREPVPNSSKITSLPKKKEVDFLLRFENHDFPPYAKYSSCSFRNMLEGFTNTESGFYSPKAHTLHNQVHLYIGGAMSDVPAAPNDPIFWLHHSFIDRIFEKWLRRHKKDASVLSETEAPIGHNKKAVIVPLFPIKTHEQMFKESGEFGYDYEDLNDKGESENDGDQDPTSGLGKCLDICPKDKTSEGPRVHPSVLLIAVAFIGMLLTL